MAKPIKYEEDELLCLIPDQVWNYILDGNAIDAVRVLRYNGYSLEMAALILSKCRDALGLS